MDFTSLSIEELAARYTERRAAFDALVALDAPTDEQVEEAFGIADELDAISKEQRKRGFAGLRNRFSETPTGGDGVEGGAPQGGDAPAGETPTGDAPRGTESQPQPEGRADEGVGEERSEERREEQPDPTQPRGEEQARSRVERLAARTPRPQTPARDASMLTITAAADVPQFSTGQALDLESLAEAVINRSRGFAPPSGDGKSVNLQQFGVANIRLPFEDDLTIDRHSDDMEVLHRAANEKRLEGGSLVAAGGWCAPSEILYDLSGEESTDGMLSLPEVQIKRGGVRFTMGPQFADFYANPGWVMTEAQAQAGNTKPCYEVSCPSFTEVRLDAVGVCIKVPILTNAAYPELIQRFVSGTMTAHQHYLNNNVIGRLVTAAGAAQVVTGIGSTAIDTLSALELKADQMRQTYRMPLESSLEVIVPFWVEGAIRSDLEARTGQSTPVTDQQIMAYFRNRNLNVQYVYDWQDLPTVDDTGTTGVNEAMVYPSTYNVLMYPAGTFVKGVSDVINLNAVYDAASLSTNVYTGLFVEQGLLVAQMKPQADLITLPVQSAGRTGAHDLTGAAGSWAV